MDSNSVIINFGFSDVVFFNYCFGQNDPVSTKLRRFLLENILDDVPQDLTCLQAPLTNERVLNLDDPLEIKLENVYLLMLNDFSGSAQANQITQLSEQILHQNKHVKNHIIAFSRSPRDKLMKKFHQFSEKLQKLMIMSMKKIMK